MTKLTEDAVLRYLSESPQPQTKREIAQAFRIKGPEGRAALKDILRALEQDGRIAKDGGTFAIPTALPAVTLVEVTHTDIDGDLFGRPVEWDETKKGPAPLIEIKPVRGGQPALSPGDRILARLTRLADNSYAAAALRVIDGPEGRIAGVVKRSGERYFLQPADKKNRDEFEISAADLGGAKDGDVVAAQMMPSRQPLRKKVRVTEVIGRSGDPRTISLISLAEAGLQLEFSSAAIAETEKMDVPGLKGREDLRGIPLVTIDGPDARDFDDAVFAEETEDGFHLIVAIADVAHYVRPGSALDRDAWKRGNSTYFPDRVVPMLPEKLSNDLCSLRPNENRACLAVHMHMSKNGEITKYKFVRGLMRSSARLTYEQVQAAMDGKADDKTGPLLDSVIKPLYKAYGVLARAREKRGALDLDLPERQVVIDAKGNMSGIRQRERLDSHKLIEEFMITANVAAATALDKAGGPGMYRVHEKPDEARMESAREFLQAMGLSLPKGQITTAKNLNGLLAKAAKLPYSHLVSEMLLRAQTQARYETENKGHFGLALQRYTHFTSPIRRYADLEVHRRLIEVFNLGAGGMDDAGRARLIETAEHISRTERASMEAERSAVDRFTAAYLSGKVGQQFTGRIRGVTRFGLFVELDDTGADGFIPMRSLPNDFYIHDERHHALVGRRSGRTYRLGAKMTCILREADGLTGSTLLVPATDLGADLPGFENVTPGPEADRGGYKGGGNRGPRGKGGGRHKSGHGQDRRNKGGKPKFRR
jgi:ribonuclease R